MMTRSSVDWVIDWIERMMERYGPFVWGKDGRWYDWGQALARERYGENWMETVPDAPSWEDVERAKRWEAGEFPDWVDRRRMEDEKNLSQL